MSTRRAVLLIADIGGYTDYMDFHRSVLGHAEAAKEGGFMGIGATRVSDREQTMLDRVRETLTG